MEREKRAKRTSEAGTSDSDNRHGREVEALELQLADEMSAKEAAELENGRWVEKP